MIDEFPLHLSGLWEPLVGLAHVLIKLVYCDVEQVLRDEHLVRFVGIKVLDEQLDQAFVSRGQ